MRRLFIRLIALACVVTVLTDGSFAPSSSSVARAQVRSTYAEGAVALGLALRRLQTTASVLHTGAHPDDEDSALIARLARGDGARVAYLSLNRGEGGQNRIGAELFDALGIIRTEELLQARRLDGGEQFFTRAFDFGFTKTREETAGRWNEREVLADMVRVIRRFRPLVVVSRWQGTPADGHGQHQFAGYLTPLALRAAADRSAFPEQLKEGLETWQVRKFYVSHFGQQAVAATTTTAAGQGTTTASGGVVEIDTGRFDPLLGRSYYEVAMEGRSQHKSQAEAALELRGAQTSRVKLMGVASDPARPLEAHGGGGEPERTVYDGLDTSVKGLAQLVGLKDAAVSDALAVIHQDAASALEKYSPQDLRPTRKALSDGLTRTRLLYSRLVDQLQTAVLNPELVRARIDAAFLLARKEREFRDALQLAHGVRVDALADAETVTPGAACVVAVRAFVPDNAARVGELRLRAPEGWRVERLSAPSKTETAFVARETAGSVAYFRVHVPADAEPTVPYWLARRAGDEPRRKGDMYVWRKDDPQTEPFAPPLLVGEVEFDAGAAMQVASAPVEYRSLDAVRGEVRRELNVVPELTVQLEPALIVVPLKARERTREVTLQLVNNALPSAAAAVSVKRASASGGLGLTSPPGGWQLTATTPFKLPSAGERVTLPHTLTIPSGARAGAYPVRATASLFENETRGLRDAQSSQTPLFGRSQHAISYPHIQTHYYYTDAETTVSVFDLQVASVRVGYIMGSGDEVPEAIKRMGLDVTMLDETLLSTGDLSRFDTIVVGVRASQTRPDFVAHHARLIEFARGGGALIVQYQRPDYAAKKLPPLPAAMEVPPARAGGSPGIARVVDERAPVRVLAPAHPVFNFPNRITEADWQGWVQERNLYNFTTFDPGYTPLLESHDAGESEQNGGQVYASIGRGHYVYTSYAWFRQLPAGVPGAYRLFANLLSLPKAAAPAGSARD